MRMKAAFLLILACCTVFTVTYLMQHRGQAGRDASAPAALPAGRESVAPYQPTPVALNRGPEVLDGFRGDVHPLLFGRTRLAVTTQWTPVGKGRGQIHLGLDPMLYSWFTELRPTRSQ